MLQFKATYSRYSNVSCMLEISAPHFFNAESWDAANLVAGLMVRGMNEAAEEGTTYKVASLSHEGLRGKPCIGFKTLWDNPPVDDPDETR